MQPIPIPNDSSISCHVLKPTHNKISGGTIMHKTSSAQYMMEKRMFQTSVNCTINVTKTVV